MVGPASRSPVLRGGVNFPWRYLSTRSWGLFKREDYNNFQNQVPNSNMSQLTSRENPPANTNDNPDIANTPDSSDLDEILADPISDVPAE